MLHRTSTLIQLLSSPSVTGPFLWTSSCTTHHPASRTSATLHKPDCQSQRSAQPWVSHLPAPELTDSTCRASPQVFHNFLFLWHHHLGPPIHHYTFKHWSYLVACTDSIEPYFGHHELEQVNRCESKTHSALPRFSSPPTPLGNI